MDKEEKTKQEEAEEVVSRIIKKNRKNYCLFDNLMMTQAFRGNISLIRHILGVITMKDYEIDRVSTQERIGPDGSGSYITLDICARDSEGRLFDIEFQTSITDTDLCLRIRDYFATMVCAENEAIRREVKRQKEEGKSDKASRRREHAHAKCVIFLVNRKEGLGRYGRYDQSEMLGEERRDGVVHYRPFIILDEFYIIYMQDVDGKTDLGSLIHDLLCDRPEDIHDRGIATVVDYFQEGEDSDMAGMKKERDFRREVREEVYQVALEKGKAEGIEQGKAEGIEQGKAEGIEQGQAIGLERGKAEGLEKGKAEIAINMISAGFDNAKIHELTGLPDSRIEELRKA